MRRRDRAFLGAIAFVSLGLGYGAPLGAQVESRLVTGTITAVEPGVFGTATGGQSFSALLVFDVASPPVGTQFFVPTSTGTLFNYAIVARVYLQVGGTLLQGTIDNLSVMNDHNYALTGNVPWDLWLLNGRFPPIPGAGYQRGFSISLQDRVGAATFPNANFTIPTSLTGFTFRSASFTKYPEDPANPGQYLAVPASAGMGTVEHLAPASGRDGDVDAIPDVFDNCPTIANANQLDANGDGYGDVCIATSAVIGSRATIGSGLVIGDRSLIAGAMRLGNNVTIGQRTQILGPGTIGNDASIGSRALILPGAGIGNNVIIQDDAHVGANADLADGVRVNTGARVLAGASVDVGSVVGANSEVGGYATVGQSVIIGPNVMIGFIAQIGDGARIGSGSTIRAGAIIGSGAVIGTNVVVGVSARVASGAIVPNGTRIPNGGAFPAP